MEKADTDINKMLILAPIPAILVDPKYSRCVSLLGPRSSAVSTVDVVKVSESSIICLPGYDHFISYE